MPIYLYEGKSLKGQLFKGKLEAQNEEAVIEKLREQKIYPLKIREYNAKLEIDLNKYKKLSLKDIALMCRQLYFGLSSGIPLLKTLGIVKMQIENKKLKEILNSVYINVQRGMAFSEALKEHEDIPNMLIYMIAVGETTGNLDKIINDMADYYDKSNKQKEKIKASLIYPKFLLFFALGVVVALLTFVLPKFIDNIISGGGKLPKPTRFLINLSNFIKADWYIIILVLVLWNVIYKLIIKKSDGYKFWVDKLKVTNRFIGKIVNKIVTARFARTFSMLMGGGLSVIKSLEISADAVGNVYTRKMILESKELISKGNGIAESLELFNIFPLLMTQMIKVGEETGSLDALLNKTAAFYEDEAELAMQKLVAIIEPSIIIGLAILVGFMVISMILPMFEMMNTIH